MSMLVIGFTIAGGIAGGFIGGAVPNLMGKERIRTEFVTTMRNLGIGLVLGAVICGTGAAALSNDNEQSGLKETFSISAQPSDIETCAAAAPKNSTVHFTRNEDGSSVCTYEMK